MSEITNEEEETQSHLSETVEDYLQLILIMQREGGPIIAARVKERKGVSAPTAWATLKRMERDGYVELGEGHNIRLSEKGQKEAETILRHHMLAERLLTDILKLNWADADKEAHRMQHSISPLVEQQILAMLGNPTTCPHGNPIPGLSDGPGVPIRRLRDVEEGSMVVVNNIAEHAEDDLDLMHYLERNNLVPNVRLLVEEVTPSNGTIAVSQPDYDNQRVVVGISPATFILVRD